MPRVFLSFRKADSRWMRDRVHQALTGRFGVGEVFKSGRSIPAGADFAEILRRQAAECEVMLVLIGPAWLDARDDDGTRLIDRAHDWVRVEIGTALKAGNRVVPVLLGDATMLPGESELPYEIAELARLQFLRVAETHLADELDRLCATLADLVPDIGRGPEQPAAAVGPAAGPTVTMTARVSGGGSAYQAAGDQTIRLA
ncbi:toll/interleukin-1 receptor domain-containing protein [Streptomyces beihaiensis]|uniref:Toll/interleukin-1 receptor domain-containing protein n=1 Tax=Streptomyces beihaiensis TaxID=2984495 RepID=A0ABT3TYS3_9ACTN|nr:toll/interleukin-1 receptor domain-containing protein [Streptomyces beihaiensis]MCX3061935.1 toll/interleukin-1 receptor domain-containing protein [Streptomyces beihaiensis]